MAMLRLALGLLGLAGVIVCAGLFIQIMVAVAHIGSCASGGPYVVARRCPSGASGFGIIVPGFVVSTLALLLSRPIAAIKTLRAGRRRAAGRRRY